MVSPRLILITLVILVSSLGNAIADKRVALVIGNSAYSKVASLPNPANDASSIAAMLRASGFGSVDLKLDLSASDMRRALRDFGVKSREADVAVLYYAGHGIELDGINYLIPVDAALEADADVMDEAVALDRVLFAIEPARQTRLVILDACRDNPFAKKMKRTMASRAIGRGLAKVEPSSPNTVIAFAAKAGSTASDGDSRNSPFAIALVEHLPKPGLDLRRAFGFVRDDVLKSTGNRQEPYVYGSLGGDDVPLVPAKSQLAGPTPDHQVSVRRDYELALQAGDRDAWEAFLQTHPEGFYANLARVQLKKLTVQQATAGGTAKVNENGGGQSPSADLIEEITPPKEGTVIIQGKGQKETSIDPSASNTLSKTELIASLQLELRRVGCFAAPPTGQWDLASQLSLAQFNKFARTSFEVNVANIEAYDGIRTKPNRICPLTCAHGYKVDGDHCAKVVKPRPSEARPQSRNSTPIESLPPKQQASGQVLCNSQGCRPVTKGCRIEWSRNPTGKSTANQYEKCD
jgi:hypothetical protein